MSPAVLFTVFASTGGIQALDEGWQYRWGDDAAWASAPWEAPGWSPLTLPGQAPKPPQREAWLWQRVRVPENDWREATLKLDGVVGHFELYLDGEKVFQHPPGGVDAKGSYGMPFFLVSLPAGSAGKVVALRNRTTYYLAGIVGRASMGERSELIADIVQADVPRVAVGALLLIIGLFSLFVLVPTGQRRLAATFALLSLSAGVYTLHFTQLKQLAFGVPGIIWFVGWCVSIAVVPASTLLFVTEVVKPAPRALTWVVRAHLVTGSAYVLATLVAWGTRVIWGPAAEPPTTAAFTYTGIAARLTILASVVVVTWHLARHSRGERSEQRVQARLMLLGIGALGVAAAAAVSSALGVARYGAASHLYLGLLALVLACAAVAGRVWAQAQLRALELAREIEKRSREKEALLRDLHDGIGGVTTNIRMLAELGKLDGGKANDALTTIAELSSEGLAELRAFTQTLDDAAVTWPGFFAELRRYGGQLIESHGKTFSMTTRLNAEGQVSSIMCLAVLRVFREALTNIVKHADARRVDVEVEVDGTAFSLQISDDGSGKGKGGGLDTGRGVNNMRSRARELGGELTISKGAGLQLHLKLPIPPKTPGPGAQRVPP
ncbi:MAG: hypothetical protein JNK82_14575 [Myxococcaceae bacterium]|nr:hypothetical protein [Myxococcaceae bacterium]